MINPRELRIGNLVYTQGRKLITLKDKIIAIDKVVPQSCQNYEPIPLTPEWLERAGFEKIDYGGIRLGGVDEMDSAGKYVLGNFTMHYLKKFWIKPDHYIWVESVHQLQNLYFALTGEELKMKEE